MRNILKKIHAQINNIYKIYHIKYILVAISGGPDSICLIKLISNYQILHRTIIHYIYIDHQWKYDSKLHVEHLINQIKYYQSHITIYQMNKIQSSETNTRKIRYKIILNHAIHNKYSAIMTGHHNTDKIETFIQQIIRGTSINGATSLTFMNKIQSIFFFVH